MGILQGTGRMHLPRWAVWCLDFGTAGKNKRAKRQQRALNSFALFNGLYTLAFAIGYVIYNPDLWPVAIVVAGMCLITVSTPIVYQYSPPAAAVAATILGCANLLAQTYLLGTGAGIHFYFFVFPVSVLVVLGPGRIGLLCFATALCIVGILFSIYHFDQPALAAAQDVTLQSFLLVLAVIWTSVLVINVAFVSYSEAEQAEDALELEHARSEALLKNLLPEEVALRLKQKPDAIIADSLPNVAILFADIVDFTPRAASVAPERIVAFLNDVFSAFDELADRYGLEKIKTIGDAYMVAAGLRVQDARPVHRAASMALDMQRTARGMSRNIPDGVGLRIGLNSGPAIAGVIGRQKPFYDVWGETVNTASRMESHSEEGRILVTETVHRALKDSFNFERRGVIEVKGVGPQETWWLTGEKLSRGQE